MVFIQINGTAIRANIFHKAGFIVRQTGHFYLFIGGISGTNEPFHDPHHELIFVQGYTLAS
jgi:hypothetical protein